MVFRVSVLLLAFYLLASQLLIVEGDYQLSIKVHSYSNPSHKHSNGGCCDLWCFSNCDNIFTFCLNQPGSSTFDKSCSLGSTTSGHAGGDDLEFNDRVGSLPNPFVMAVSGPWPGSFQLRVDIHDKDIFTSDDFVDEVFVEPAAPFPLGVRSGPTPYPGLNRRGTITLSFEVNCSPNFYGSDCSTQCTPTENYTCESDGRRVCVRGYSNPSECVSECDIIDSSQRNFTCNPDGTIQCLPDYYGPECNTLCQPVVGRYRCDQDNGSRICEAGYYGTDCDIKCVARDNVLLGHYSCDPDTGERVCLPGFHDPDSNCTKQLCEPLCNLSGGRCNATSLQCQCRGGWSGDQCEECVTSQGCTAVTTPSELPSTTDPVLSNTTANSSLSPLPPAEAANSSENKSTAHYGVIVGVLVGVVVLLSAALLSVCVVLLCKARRKKQHYSDDLTERMLGRQTTIQDGLHNPSYDPSAFGETRAPSDSSGQSPRRDFQNPLYNSVSLYSYPSFMAATTETRNGEEGELSSSSNSGAYSTIDNRPAARTWAARPSIINT